MTKSISPRNIVLYADDDIDDLELVISSFDRYTNNVEVITFRDGTEIVEYLDKLTSLDPHPCLIILDINMPLLNGKDTLVKIRKMPGFESVPVVLFSTSSQPTDGVFAKKYNAGFVTKPLEHAQMRVITDQFIDHCSDEIKKNIRKYLQ
jgi:CheY-like chemotaxis protein